MRFIFLLIAVSVCFAQGSNAISAGTADAADTSSANQAVFADINIFSQMPLGSVLILWSNIDLDADIKRQITSRSFVLEPYFMQNIDREQFEQNQILHLFAEQKKAFFKLFPDDEED
ncbi:MAG: hypothetical protein LBB36_02395 [Fibromonadaceae bacterium]|jgi:hypothetical protein|nr:hypothetical protein [Fibromonadaceae bacterium]